MVCTCVHCAGNLSRPRQVLLCTCSSILAASPTGVTAVREASQEEVTLTHTWLNMKAELFHVIYAPSDSRVNVVFRDIMRNISSPIIRNTMAA